MTAYLDEFRPLPGRGAVARLIAESDAELDALAVRLRLSVYWWKIDHYWVPRAAERAAIGFGAQRITRRQLSAMRALRKRGEAMGRPETALERLAALLRERACRRGVVNAISAPATLTESSARAQDSAANHLRSDP